MKLRCQRCGFETPEEAGFCFGCRYRISARSRYDLAPGDFAYGPDRDAIEMIKATGVLPYLVKNLALADLEKKLASKIVREARSAAHMPEVDALVRYCAIALCVDTLPETLIVEDRAPNAFTFGSEERAFVVISSGALRSLTKPEMVALLAHELAHVKSGHMLYHTVAEILGGGIGVSASFFGFDIVALPIRLALLSWHRESEVSADRAGLLVVNDISVIRSFMTKLAARSSRDVISSSGFDIENARLSMLESASELLQTHPLYVNRFRHVKDFFESEEFLPARRKIETRLKLLKALIPVCRFCGLGKRAEDLFCPSCGRCQI